MEPGGESASDVEIAMVCGRCVRAESSRVGIAHLVKRVSNRLETGFTRWVVLTLLTCLMFVSGCGSLGPGVPAADRDGDGLSDARERALGTDPDDPDTDGDGALDGDELADGTSPLAADSDHDGILDGADETINPAAPRGDSVSSGNDVEPNDSFDEPVRFEISGSGTLTIEGQIDRARDVDVFDIGRFSPGDRLTVDFDRVDDDFSPSAAIFDGEESLFYSAQDLHGSGGPDLSGFIKETIRHRSARYYFAVAPRDDEPTLGFYRFDITIERGRTVPSPTSQTVFLDFDGGSPNQALLGISEVPPFDAAEIMPMYAGQEKVIKQSIIETVARSFSEFDVVIISSDDTASPPGDNCTTILFGSDHDSALGVSVGVDAYNRDLCDDGIIFTEAFVPDAFGFAPEPEALGVAIGNVAAHEAGHLLGLNHVDDSTALMDEVSPAVHLLTDQEFKTAPLSESVFPFGQQDARTLLAEIVGRR